MRSSESTSAQNNPSKKICSRPSTRDICMYGASGDVGCSAVGKESACEEQMLLYVAEQSVDRGEKNKGDEEWKLSLECVFTKISSKMTDGNITNGLGVTLKGNLFLQLMVLYWDFWWESSVPPMSGRGNSGWLECHL